LQVGSQQYQFKVFDFLHVVAYYTARPAGILDEIELKLFMIMEWKVEGRFYPAEQGKTVALGKRGDFPQNSTFHILAASQR
jgi:hypothetical protein